MDSPMSREISLAPLTQEAFAPFGDVIEMGVDGPTVMINQGMCGRYNDLINIDVEGDVGVSLFHGQSYELPLSLKMVERHPRGSQAFIPMSEHPFLVVVAEDEAGVPVRPRAFMTAVGQGVNYHRNTWHGVLTPLGDTRLFAVVDRIGGDNLEEHWFDAPLTITA